MYDRSENPLKPAPYFSIAKGDMGDPTKWTMREQDMLAHGVTDPRTGFQQVAQQRGWTTQRPEQAPAQPKPMLAANEAPKTTMPKPASIDDAFVAGYIEECMERGLAPWQVKVACAVGQKLAPFLSETFQKFVKQSLVNMPTTGAKPDTGAQLAKTDASKPPPMKPKDEATAFMNQHMKRKAKENKIKDPAAVSSASGIAWKNEAGKKVIGDIANARRSGAGIPGSSTNAAATM